MKWDFAGNWVLFLADLWSLRCLKGESGGPCRNTMSVSIYVDRIPFFVLSTHHRCSIQCCVAVYLNRVTGMLPHRLGNHRSPANQLTNSSIHDHLIYREAEIRAINSYASEMHHELWVYAFLISCSFRCAEIAISLGASLRLLHWRLHLDRMPHSTFTFRRLWK